MHLPITKCGFLKLQQDLEKFLTVDKPKLISAIEEARKHGDLKENAEYHSAKELYVNLSNKINELQITLSNSRIVDVSSLKSHNTIVFGATVHLEDINKLLKKYQLVGTAESDLDNNKISIASPLAQSLLNKKKGDNVMVVGTEQEIVYKVIDIEYV